MPEIMSIVEKHSALKGLIDRNEAGLVQALGDSFPIEKYKRVALECIKNGGGYMQSCMNTPEGQASLISCVMQFASLGLSLDPILGHAYPVPFNSKLSDGNYGVIITPVVGYRGMIWRGSQEPGVRQMLSECVYECDTLKRTLMPNEVMLTPGPDAERVESKLIGAVAVCYFEDGHQQHHYMPVEAINKIREKQLAQIKNETARKYSPWVTHYLEMVQKTPLRGLWKRLPISPELIEVAVREEYRDEGVLDTTATVTKPASERPKSLGDVAADMSLPEMDPETTHAVESLSAADSAQELEAVDVDKKWPFAECQARYDCWDTWCDNLVGGKNKTLSPKTWRECSQGGRGGGRYSVLFAAVKYGKEKLDEPAGPWFQKAAVALQVLMERIEEKEPKPEPEPENLF